MPLKSFFSKFKTVEIEKIGERENDVPNNTPGHNSVFLMIVRMGEREWQERPKNRDRLREKKSTCHTKPSLLLEASSKKAVCVGIFFKRKFNSKYIFELFPQSIQRYMKVCALCMVCVCLERGCILVICIQPKKKGRNEKGFMTASSHDAPMSDIVVECVQNSWLDSLSTGLDIFLNIYTTHTHQHLQYRPSGLFTEVYSQWYHTLDWKYYIITNQNNTLHENVGHLLGGKWGSRSKGCRRKK